MTITNTKKIAHELFKRLKDFSQLRWEMQSPIGLRPSEMELRGLLYLSTNEEKRALSASELSSMLNITPAGVTHLINPLEKKGFIERKKDPNDRRVVLVGFTEKGNQIGELVIERFNETLAGLVDHLGEKDSKTLIQLISSVVEYLTANPLK